ncbi:hypothetical protein [Flavobacterium sp. JAS]|uniref:hypothetical protein n=1 Tax=Flavobacterium sp. JAS TaxID=2897329 RepID=UPI001E364A9F|nr:hypothetical protein [Flavobacterium sp. JAS]MCD0471518.1 hypothetical protein [Flavobacterium sp. JAS]
MTINDLKYKIEKNFRKIKLQNDIYGFQIQPNTKFLKGISRKEIDKLEILFGFVFPKIYHEILLVIGGFDIKEISIDPDGDEIKFNDCFYQYPRDIEKSKWLVEEINENKIYAESALCESGFDVSKIVGYVPIYSHRALVVFENKNLSPVISAWGSDIIVYGNNLEEYLKNEFLRY